MESDVEDLENIFEEHDNNEIDAGNENTDNKSSNETSEAVKIAPPKRIIKNPRLKFNAERLIGERGIPVLLDHFKNVKFKGPGREKEDLDKLLSKLEHWAHRLFPSMKFEDCLTHIERLGKKRPVQTCLRKIRLDMPIPYDFVKDNEEDNVKRNDDSEPEEINAFDRLLGERKNEEISNIDLSAPEFLSNISSFPSSPVSDGLRSHVLGSSFGSSLTEEQRKKMEHNKMLAAERRKARLAAMEQNTSRLQSENHETIFSKNDSNEQSSFNKLLDSSECGENAEKLNTNTKTSHEFEENSEKLGLDDLMNLVNEEVHVSDENAISLPSEVIESVSSNINESLKNSEKYSEEDLSMKSDLDVICETSVDCKVNSDAGCSMKDTSVNNENVILENEDLTCMDCENKTS